MKKGAIFDLLELVVGMFFVAVFIGALISFLTPTKSNQADDIVKLLYQTCNSEDGVGVLTSLEVDRKSSIIQVRLPLSEDTRFDYPRNTFDVLAALDSNSLDIVEESKKYPSLLSARKNYDILDKCRRTTCLCVVRTDMPFMTYKNAELTACFPRLYAYARSRFDFYLRSGASTNMCDGLSRKECNYKLFEFATQQTLYYLENEDGSDEANEIVECYELFDKYHFSYVGEQGQYFFLAQGDEIMTNNDVEANFLEEYYSLTKLGMFSDISDCIEIPKDEGSCFCPYLSNTLVSGGSNAEGIVLGIAGSYDENDQGDIDIGAFILSVDKVKDCHIVVETEQS